MNYNITLYMDYLLGLLMTYDADKYPEIVAHATNEMDAEVRAQGFINCGECPFDSNCNLNHRGDCAYH